VARGKANEIPKQLVWEAYQKVKANRGAAGVDGQSLAAFEEDLKGNLYKVWNRMSSGSYFPPPVRLVEIPKDDGGKRPLGIPTVADRVAQTVVKMILEPCVEPIFHRDSYGYRPGKSALDAVGVTRRRCWELKAFFDSLDYDLVERAVAHHTDVPWVRLYIRRWLRASVQMPDGTLAPRVRGTPRPGDDESVKFDFLGYTFQPRRVRTRQGKYLVSFLPAMSTKAAKAVRRTIRGWRMASTRTHHPLEDLARLVNPVVRGWMNYYGRFYRSRCVEVLRHLNEALAAWVQRKFTRFRNRERAAMHWLGRVARREPYLFAHWQLGMRPAAGV
jgi:retron-type reverse transcriptase